VETMDLEYKPMPAVLGNAAASIDIEVEKDLTTGFNLVGVIPGSDPELSQQYIVIGAHYDHLGTGGPESSRPDLIGQIHPGADDNASGCAAVLEIARWAKQLQPPLKRSVLVCLFSGEEVGAVGSAALVRRPPVPHSQIDCMLNFDMVGRLRDDKLLLGGAGTALEFDDLLAGLDEAHDMTFSQDRSGFGGSDHLNFMQHDDPVLFFFTGAHPQYHSPLDTPDLINYEGIERVAGVAEDLISRVDKMPGMLTFVRPEGAPTSQRNVRESISVSMGTIPSFEEHDQPGYLLGDVRPGGPADAAGLKGGDLITKIRDRKIASIYDFMFALEDVEPGQTVTVIFMRDGEEHTVEVTLEAKSIQE
jgi:aminopeptidase YwaD